MAAVHVHPLALQFWNYVDCDAAGLDPKGIVVASLETLRTLAAAEVASVGFQVKVHDFEAGSLSLEWSCDSQWEKGLMVTTCELKSLSHGTFVLAQVRAFHTDQSELVAGTIAD